jgi:ribose/xylose/arabinose/galactoside ABC-type transport system permease subunit
MTDENPYAAPQTPSEERTPAHLRVLPVLAFVTAFAVVFTMAGGCSVIAALVLFDELDERVPIARYAILSCCALLGLIFGVLNARLSVPRVAGATAAAW